MIESRQLDQAMSVTSLMQHAHGQLPLKRVRRTEERQCSCRRHVLQLPWQQHCYGCVLMRHRTYCSTGLGIVTSLTYSWLLQC